jgi:hypothetical protein
MAYNKKTPCSCPRLPSPTHRLSKLSFRFTGAIERSAVTVEAVCYFEDDFYVKFKGWGNNCIPAKVLQIITH